MGRRMRLLRLNSRHHLYYHPTYDRRGGALTVLGWSLNPIGSIYDGKQMNLWEPLWLFRLRQRWFAFAGRQRCGRRDDLFSANRGDGPQPDTWDWGPDGNRTCSYCGSIHFDDLMKICRLVPDDPRYGIDSTDKSYKVYVRQPGVRNASEGAIKFYKQHAPEKPTEEQQALFSAAMRASATRYHEEMVRMRKQWEARQNGHG